METPGGWMKQTPKKAVDGKRCYSTWYILEILGIWDFLNIEDCAQWSRWSVSICMVYCQCFELTNLDMHFESIPEIYPNSQACDEVPFAVRWEWPWFWLVLFRPWATKLRHFCAFESGATQDHPNTGWSAGCLAYQHNSKLGCWLTPALPAWYSSHASVMCPVAFPITSMPRELWTWPPCTKSFQRSSLAIRQNRGLSHEGVNQEKSSLHSQHLFEDAWCIEMLIFNIHTTCTVQSSAA